MNAPPDQHLIERRLDGRSVLSGGFLEVCRDDVSLPDGSLATREFIRHGGAVAVVPLLDDGRLVLVRQYRYPLSKVLLEFPAGKRDAGESTLACAMRELREETGYSAREWAYGGELHNAAAYSTESIWIWFARGLQGGAQQLDAGEFVETVVLSQEELLALDGNDELPDAKTLIGLHWLSQRLAGGRPWNWQAAEHARDPDAVQVRLRRATP
jgi:ADP-ribose pyrophosphatase